MSEAFADFDDIESLVELFSASSWNELRIVADGFELVLSDAADFDDGVAALPQLAAANRADATANQPASAATGTPGVAPELDLTGLVAVRAPSLGHFYRSPKPGAPPFVEIGQHVAKDDTICVIEVMKLFTLLSAGLDGIVRHICVEDAAMVEYDQPLFYLEPSA